MTASPVRIGIIGDFHPEYRSHQATPGSLQHAGAKLGLQIESKWIPTSSLIKPDAAGVLAAFDGLWASAGSPYESMEGMLRGIRFARERDWPFLGTCGGFQYAVIEVARNIAGLTDADTAENRSQSSHIVITAVSCAVPNRAPDAPKLSGVVPQIRLRPGSFLQRMYGQDVVEEEFFCNYEINPEYEYCLMEAGLAIVARGANGEARAIESGAHKFFLATLFQPQLSSSEGQPHPVVVNFVKAAQEFAGVRQEADILE